MLARAVLVLGGALFALKIFAPERLRALGKQLDRVVNATLIALGIVYSVEVVIWLFSR